jgi:ElaB/YqjD/DUF883 family membrane-anchored ribosome-binding protein
MTEQSTDTDTDTTTLWNDLRRIADELELKIHLAGMDARDRWQALRPRLAELERTIAHTGERAGKLVTDELSAVGKALRQLRDDIAHRE